MALFKEMTDAGLREAYWSERALAANWDNMTKGARNPKLLRRASSGVLRALRNIDIIVAIARKRGVSLTRPAGGKRRSSGSSFSTRDLRRAAQQFSYDEFMPMFGEYSNEAAYMRSKSGTVGNFWLANQKGYKKPRIGGKRKHGVPAPTRGTCSRCGKPMLWSKSVTGWNPARGMTELMHARCARGAGKYPRLGVAKLAAEVKGMLR